jgi:hypothetical protein
MYAPHPVFEQPSDEYVKVWKYMDFTKFVSMLDSSKLYFTRADKLNDPFEGSFPKINVAARQQVPEAIPPESREAYIKAMTNMEWSNKQWPRFHAINCWHMNEHESAAMWKLYLKSDEGIAIQSTFMKLRESFIGDEEVYLGVVKYIDYESEWVDSKNMFIPFVHKRKSFEHEREVRAVVLKWPIVENNTFCFDKDTIEHGLKIRVDMKKMVEHLYVAPSAPDWFFELVDAVIKRYGYEFQAIRSKLDEQPVF